MNRSTRQAIALLKQALPGAYSGAQAKIDAAIKLLSPRKAKSAFSKGKGAAHRVKVAAKIRKRQMSTAEIRAAVRERAGGVCEACEKRWGFWGWSMDHFMGGSGRKRERQSVETCWALCGTGTTGCHGDRTRNEPDAQYWNLLFEAHCAKYGYPVLAHVVHEPVPRRSA